MLYLPPHSFWLTEILSVGFKAVLRLELVLLEIGQFLLQLAKDL